MDTLRVHTTARLTDAHLGGIAAGHDLDGGVLDLEASNDALNVDGTGKLAGIPSRIHVDMDFRDGAPAQVVQRISVSGTADATQLAGFGLDAGAMLSGPVALQADLQTRRNGLGEITAHADLAQATVTLPQVDWSKPAGQSTVADMHGLLDHGRLAGIDRVRLLGDGVDLQGTVEMSGGRPVVARLQRMMLGTNTDVHGDLGWPARSGAPWTVTASGRSLDASGAFAGIAGAGSKPADDALGPPWQIQAHFDRVFLGQGRAVSDIDFRAVNDGRMTTQARLAGRTSAKGAFSITIGKAPGGRRLAGTAEDTGGLLRALDVRSFIEGGRATLSGTYHDLGADHPLSGKLELVAFRVRNAPMMAQLLQAMTLHGLVQMVQGTGLAFARLTAPFRLNGDVLELTDARAFELIARHDCEGNARHGAQAVRPAGDDRAGLFLQ